MKQISGTWFEVKVRYEQTQENGLEKMVTETYVYKAADFGEAFDKAIKAIEERVVKANEIVEQIINGTYKTE